MRACGIPRRLGLRGYIVGRRTFASVSRMSTTEPGDLRRPGGVVSGSRRWPPWPAATRPRPGAQHPRCTGAPGSSSSRVLRAAFYPALHRDRLSHLVGPIPVNGRLVAYTVFVAPGLWLVRMNGPCSIPRSLVFMTLKIAKTYDAMLATPLAVGDIAWAT